MAIFGVILKAAVHPVIVLTVRGLSKVVMGGRVIQVSLVINCGCSSYVILAMIYSLTPVRLLDILKTYK